MIKEVITVPKDKCPLDVLAEMGTQTADSWIFLHESAIEKLRTTADVVDACSEFLKMLWRETESYLSTTIMVEESKEEWRKVYCIKADDIAFDYEPSDPKYLFFLKMAD